MSMIADSLIFKLPKYVFLNFCSDWISVVDFCKFDSAVSNSNSRLLFDGFASSGNLLISDDGVGTSLSSKCFNWLIKRNYLIKTLTAPSNVLPVKEFLARKEVKAIFKRLKSISFVHDNTCHKTKNKGILLAGRQEALIQNCVSLETLDISRSHNTLSPKFFDSVGTHCLLLKKLIINEGVDENSTSARLLREQKVAVISLADAVTKIITGCKLLEEIYCVQWLPDEVVVALAKNSNRLRIFRYGINHFDYNLKTDGDVVLSALAEHCSELREFYIPGTFSDNVFEKFVCGCQHLTKLHFSYFSDSLTDTNLASIATHCKHLTYLDLEDCGSHTVTVEGFAPLLQQCKSLTHLILVPELLPVAKVCDLFLMSGTRFNLQYLKMSYSDEFEGIEDELESLEGDVQCKDLIAENRKTKLKLAQLRELMVPYELETAYY